MAYLNLIYRRKADVDYGNAAAVKADMASAEDWSTKAMGTRKANEEKKKQGPWRHHHGFERQPEVSAPVARRNTPTASALRRRPFCIGHKIERPATCKQQAVFWFAE